MSFRLLACSSKRVGVTQETRVRVTTSAMAYGPHAVGRVDGKVVFVRGAAPDEEVEAVLREERRAFAYADAVSILRPSLQRRDPPCPYLPRCGGCPWQHLTYGAQLKAKRDIVREHLRRIAALDVPVAPALPSPREFGYRQRLKLRVEQRAVGFYAAGSHTLVPVEHCLLGARPADAAIAWAADLVRAVRCAVRRIEIISRGDGSEDVVMAGEVEGAWVPDDEPCCAAWQAAHQGVAGLMLSGRGWRRTWGDTRVSIEPEPGLSLLVHAGSFTQVNPAANQLLVDTVLRLADPRPNLRVVDLYAGAGNFSLPVARRGATVLAVEHDPRSAADATANARQLALAQCRVRRARAEHAIEELVAAGARFDVAVLDPPRSGAAAVLAPLMQLAPPRIIYVSCNPATLARDLRRLAARYRIDLVQPLDMFPHTYHVETVVRAELACETSGARVSSDHCHDPAGPAPSS